MTRCLDSSVLVAALVEDEPNHEACLALLRGPRCAAWSHALAETYSTLTGGRLGIRVAPALAAALVREQLEPRLALVDLPPSELAAALADAASAGARGGAAYDFLHLAAARRASADTFCTLDARAFAALARDGDPRIERPGA